MKLFVTGGTGFIGSHFLAAASAIGHEVIALRRPNSVTRISLGTQPQWLDGSLEDDWRAVLGSCNALVHLAAVGVSPQKASWAELFRWNVSASLGLWLQAVESGVRRIVVCGSCMEYGRSAARYDAIPASAPLEPVTGYGACKAAASVAAIALAAEHQVEMAIVRPFTVYGEGQHASNFLPSLLAAADSGQDFPMSPGEQVRDFQSVSDCAAAFLKVLQRPIQAGVAEITNTGSGVPRTLLAFAQEQWELRNARGKLLVGALPYRKNEVMRFVPLL